jgi:hypothetical protein
LKNSVITAFSSEACRMDIAAAPTMIVSKKKVNLFLLLAIAIAARSKAPANIRHGETALCNSAPAQTAPPKARAL